MTMDLLGGGEEEREHLIAFEWSFGGLVIFCFGRICLFSIFLCISILFVLMLKRRLFSLCQC